MKLIKGDFSTRLELQLAPGIIDSNRFVSFPFYILSKKS